MDTGGLTWTYAATAFWAAETGGRLLAPLVIARAGERALLLASLGVGAAATLLLVGAASTAAHVIVIAGVAGFGLAPAFPLMWAGVIRDVAPARPSAVGPLFASGGVGGALLPWLVGIVSTGSGLGAGLLVPLVALAAMIALTWRGGSWRRRA
jgi:fucose permease